MTDIDNEFLDLAIENAMTLEEAQQYDAQLYYTADTDMLEYGSPAAAQVVLEDDKMRTTFLKRAVKHARSSPEYSRYRKYLAENFEMDRCSLFRNLNAEALSGDVEIHHHPITIYDICDIVFCRMTATAQPGDHITALTVANRVMELHWKGQVGLVPLTSTVHELVHNEQIVIHPAMIYGDWVQFLKDHAAWISEDIKQRLFAEGNMWERVIADGYDLTLLDVQPICWKRDGIQFEQVIKHAKELAAPSVDEDE